MLVTVLDDLADLLRGSRTEDYARIAMIFSHPIIVIRRQLRFRGYFWTQRGENGGFRKDTREVRDIFLSYGLEM